MAPRSRGPSIAADTLHCRRSASSAAVSLLLLLSSLGLASGQANIQCFAQFARGDYPFCKTLSPEYTLSWNVASGVITFAITIAGKYNMVGLGISDSGGMMGADIMILKNSGSITSGSAWTIGDYFSTNFGMPVLDSQQDWTLVSVAQDSLITMAVVQRRLDTCDMQDIQVFNDTDQSIIFAYGTSFGYHGPNRGQVPLRLNPTNLNITVNGTNAVGPGNSTDFTYRISQLEQDPSDLTSQPFFFNSVRVPTATTSYICVNMPIPMAAVKQHIIRMQGIAKSSLVHHMILWGCTGPPTNLATPYQCFSMPDACQKFIAPWAPGAGNFSLPPEAGLPWGGPAGSSTSAPIQYVALQIHYNNPAGISGVMDSSGFLLYTTQQLRAFDMGVVTLGSYNITVPPGVSNYSLTPNACPSSCTSRLNQNLTLSYTFLHMHQAGQSIVTEHIRNGTAIQPLAYKRYFNFNYQGIKQVLPQSRVLMPGDTLVTTCAYNTTGRTTTTLWGFSSQDEMCFSFVFYYPEVNWGECIQDQGVAALASCGINATNAATTAAVAGSLAVALNTSSGCVSGSGACVMPAATNLTAMAGALAAAVIPDDLTRNVYTAVQNLSNPSPADTLAASSNSLLQTMAYELSLSSVATASLASLNTSAAAMLAAVNTTSVLAALPLAVVQALDLNFSAYILPCLLTSIPPRVFHTGAAAAAILCTTVGLLILGSFLWFQYARKEDPERLALLEKLKETMLTEVAMADSNTMTEDALRARLEEVARQKIAALEQQPMIQASTLRSTGGDPWSR